jgi:hypothetical protein
MYTQKGFPYNELVDRSEEITVFYAQGADKMPSRSITKWSNLER